MTSKYSMTLEEWQKFSKKREQYIYNCSKTDASDGWTPFTIGIFWKFIDYDGSLDKVQFGLHENLVFNAINIKTDAIRRPKGKNRKSIFKTLKKNGIRNYFGMLNVNYYEILPNYKFIISPEGNGIDCHRHYEALMAGCIPIVENHDKIREKYSGCPILYTDDYSEINEEYLNKIYDEMLNKSWDFSKLFLDTYDLETQNQIKTNGNYWSTMLAKKNWYE